MQLRNLLVVVILSTCAVNGQNDDCDMDNTDPIELGKVNIFQTSVLQEMGLSEDMVEKQIEGSSSREISALAGAQEKLRAAVEAGEESLEYTPPVAAADSTAAKYIAQELALFRPVCPYRWYWLSRSRWFFLTSVSGQRKYCWAYYSTWATSCTNRYCNWWFSAPHSWYFYYRCVPKYIYIWVYARCAMFQDNTWVWSSQYIRVAVPRGCSCKRYFNPILVSRQCPATDRSLLD